MNVHSAIQRRPIKARSASWAQATAALLVRAGLQPNQISLCSTAFAVVGAVCYIGSANCSGVSAALLLTGAAACITLRLLCNLLDGMMAVENGLSTKSGEIYNEFPDRISDWLFLVAAGYAARSGEFGICLGWTTALLAVLTAYIRAFGARYSNKEDFSGPMAKPQRMWFLCGGSIAAAFEIFFFGTVISLTITQIVICIGSLWTCVSRTQRLHRAMENGS